MRDSNPPTDITFLKLTMLFAILKRTNSYLWSLYAEAEFARCIADMRGDTDTTELMQIAVELKITVAHFEACLRPF